MERLTDRFSDGTAFVPEHIKQRFGMQSVVELLASYEDLDITPGQIKEIDKLYREKCEELAECKKLEEQGLLLKLPCKAGTKAYHIVTLPLKCKKVIAEVVTDEFFIALCVMEKRFGNTVFLTKEEAIQRLAEMRGEVDAE